MSLIKEGLENSKRQPSDNDKKMGKKVLIILLPIIFIGVGLIVYFNVQWKSVDEALAKYDFVEARNIASDMACRDEGNSINGRLDCPRTEQMIKIIVAEANYMAENKQFDKAITAVDELKSLELYNKLLENNILSQSLEDLSDQLFSSIITKGILQEALTEKQVKIYLTKLTSSVKKEEIQNLIK